MGLLIAIVTLMFSVGIAIVSYIKWSHGYFRRKNLPHIKPKFPLGNCENPLKRTKNHWLVIKDIYNEFKIKGLPYGGFYMLTVPTILAVNLDVIRAILVKHYSSFSDRGIYVNENKDLLAHSVFMVPGNRWKSLRTKITPAFTPSKIKGMLDIVVKCAKPMLETVENHMLEQKPLAIKVIASCFTTDVIGSCAFGIECESFGEDHHQFRKHCNKFLETDQWRTLKLLFANVFPNMAHMIGVSDVRKDVDDFFNTLIKDTVDFREKTNYYRNDFMQLLINMKNEADNDNRLTYKELAGQVFLFFFAGSETSAATIAYTLFELSIHTDMQERVRNEIRSVLKEKNLTYDAIQEMTYLDQLFNETMRKYPAFAVLHRQCTKDCFIQEANLKVKKGQKIMISPLALHYDPEYFPEPERFDPNRFSSENKQNIKPFSFLPFGEGPKYCIGAKFAQMQTKAGLVLLLHQYRFSLNSKTRIPITFNTCRLALEVEGGIWLNVEKIK